MTISKDEFEAIEQLMRQVIREEAVTKKEFEERLKHLPTKDEFYAEMSKFYKNQENLEVDRDLLKHRVFKHTDQIHRIENHLNPPCVFRVSLKSAAKKHMVI